MEGPHIADQGETRRYEALQGIALYGIAIFGYVLACLLSVVPF